MSTNRDKWGNIIGLDEEDRIMSILNNYSPNAAQMKALFEMIGAMPPEHYVSQYQRADPNTVDDMIELERRAAIEGLRKPFTHA